MSLKLNGQTGIEFTSTTHELKVKSSNHTWSLKGVDTPIGDSQTGTAPDTTNSDSGQLAIYNGATKLWGITEGGWIQNPNVPGFSVDTPGSPTSSGGFTIGETIRNFANIHHNDGNFVNSTGIYTAPISGKYLIVSSMSFGNTSTSNIWVAIRLQINGVTGAYSIGQVGNIENNNYDTVVISNIQNLSAGDYINIRTEWNAFNGNLGYGHYCAYLIG